MFAELRGIAPGGSVEALGKGRTRRIDTDLAVIRKLVCQIVLAGKADRVARYRGDRLVFRAPDEYGLTTV